MRVVKSEGTKVRGHNLSTAYDVIFPHFFHLVVPALREQMSGDTTFAKIVYDVNSHSTATCTSLPVTTLTCSKK